MDEARREQPSKNSYVGLMKYGFAEGARLEREAFDAYITRRKDTFGKWLQNNDDLRYASNPTWISYDARFRFCQEVQAWSRNRGKEGA